MTAAMIKRLSLQSFNSPVLFCFKPIQKKQLKLSCSLDTLISIFLVPTIDYVKE